MSVGCELERARYRRLVERLERRMRRRAVQQDGGRCTCGHLLIGRREVERWERAGVPVARLRRAAREAGDRLGWDAATHLDMVGRLSVYDAAPLRDEEVGSEEGGLVAVRA